MLNASFPKPGERFAHRYVVEKVLNRGGFAQVIRASQTDLGRTVAIKILKPVNLHENSPNRDERLNVIVRRFELEAQTVSMLHDAHTIRVFEYGSTPSGLLFMVMEYVPGLDVSALVNEGPMEPARVVRIADQVLSSLTEAHTMELIHRDVKPANIMVYNNVHQQDCVKLLDFGLVKSMEMDPLFTDENPGLTGDDNIVGTPRYMAPEQIRGDQLDARSDLYSLGLVMYEMLTGERAMNDDTAMKIISRTLSDENLTLPEELEIPPVLRRVVNTMLEKNIERRPESAQAVRLMLSKWNDEEAAAPVVLPLDPSEVVVRGQSRRWMPAAVVGVVALLIGFSFLTNQNESALGTDVEATTEPGPTNDGFDFEPTSPAEDALSSAQNQVYEAIPDARMLEIALNAAQTQQRNEPVSEPKNSPKKRKRKKKKKKKENTTELQIRTLDGKK